MSESAELSIAEAIRLQTSVKSYANVRNLTISGTIPQQTAVIGVAAFPKLKKLIILACNSPEVIVNGCYISAIEELIIVDCPLGPKLFDSISRNQSVTSVHFAGGFELPENSINALLELASADRQIRLSFEIPDPRRRLRSLANSQGKESKIHLVE
jgi:hypothetical protein